MSPEPLRLAGLVLAAGGATRFGAPKQLAALDGEPLVRRAVRLAGACCDAGVVAVTGAHAATVGAALDGSGARIVVNNDWPSGMGGSLACGVAALPADADGCLVLLCDQPAVDAADLAALVAAWRQSPRQAAAAAYGEVRGVPAIFPADLWPALSALRGDRGARAVLAALPRLTAVPMPHAAMDVDTVADLQRLHRR